VNIDLIADFEFGASVRMAFSSTARAVYFSWDSSLAL